MWKSKLIPAFFLAQILFLGKSKENYDQPKVCVSKESTQIPL